MRKTRSILFLALLATAISAAAQSAPPAKAPAAPKAGTFERALLQPATLKAKAPDVYDVKFNTTAGDFTVRVTRAWSPNGADRFYNLVRHHFYDGASFFRVLSGFMAQFGISAYPQVSEAWQEASIKDDPVTQSNKRGYITFAMAGPNTRTTQVFINYGNNAALDKMGFSPFGVVTDGMNVVDKLYSGYGEGPRAPSQGLISQKGHVYLEQGFPKLDTIKSAELATPAPKEPAAQ